MVIKCIIYILKIMDMSLEGSGFDKYNCKE